MNVEKISVALDKNTLARLQNKAESEGISRSKLVTMAVNEYLDELTGQNVEVIGILNIVYDEEAGEVTNSIEHQFEDSIISTLHVHVNEKLCMEAIAVKGKRSKLEELAKKLSSVKGVKKS
ncbi:CopG family ribbon-helix-helix protein [Metallosphaera hakonensis]|uniref:CopG family ribbon-helix-helix protein n=1 Tax=Metallosphaera hakonensis TaxID=79601 RepID=UPI000AE4C6EB|nr:CopG family ribbon-helix-helix protein [Metallosphaera hakonensis]